MTPEPLRHPYIGITLYKDDYAKVKGLLPTPSYRSILSTYHNQKIVLIYAIEGYITSPHQYRWISNIKLGLKEYLCVSFEYEEDYHITSDTYISTTLYTIEELSKAFKAPLIDYPKIMYPSIKKEIYRNLCWYGKRLVHQKCFTLEAMIATALFMNKQLDDKYQHKELHKKALGAYIFIDENKEAYSVRLDEVQLKKAHSKGGQLRREQRVQETKDRIKQLLKHRKYHNGVHF